MYCIECKQVVTSKFCPDCGSKPVEAVITRVCPNCNIEVTSKFCPDCGSKPVESMVITEGKRVMMCPNCNIEVTSRFCPECGAKPEERFVATGGSGQGSPAPVQQGPSEADGPCTWVAKGEECEKNEKYEEAMEWYLKAVEEGDLDACCSIGYLYKYGKGVEEDDDKALEWFTLAADQGSVLGMIRVMDYLMYEKEEYLEASRKCLDIFEQDKKKLSTCMSELDDVVEMWENIDDFGRILEEEGDKGNAYVQYYLGLGYFNELFGLDEDTERGLELLQKSASQGFVGAMNWFVSYYSDYLDEDWEEGMKWFVKAIQTGWDWSYDWDEFAKLASGLDAGKDTSVSVILKQEVSKGNRYALYALAICYACGYSVDKDPIAAMKYAKEFSTKDFYLKKIEKLLK